MEYVEPIRDLEQIRAIKQSLKKRSARDYLLFTLGINTGLRVSHLLELRLKHIVDEDAHPKEFLFICADEPAIYLNKSAQQAIRLYLEEKTTLRLDEHVFISNYDRQAITRQQAYRIIRRAATDVGIHDHIGTHTLRKTFGYHAFIQGVSLSLLKERFHHATPSETLNYIGIKREESGVPLINVNL
ncbi:tyrosine-type recombinase/integrase [Natribacillus halophilus]|uniref:Phage integrase family protein n=1 Tax=Natribacillus halophilus TaxID=549003 RepID=A0A1G8JP93_9BACI|nr:tyrosine-type recombinase/integrase [Natribacillus halophilus]SDI33038.1 Phage integrase family protein [Natribacillus halophilus]